jgi:mannose-6-phosphate isomerase-like protein (cupin superfamily)
MDGFKKDIWKELLGSELAVQPPATKSRPKKDALPTADHWSSPVLMERAVYLRSLARHGDGQASETLNQYPQHTTMLSFRARDGEAELHENFADLFCILDGGATLVTGGTVVEPRTVGPGEVRGTAIDAGIRQELRAGDVAHVPAGVPHQILVQGERTFTSFVVKIQQNS